MELILIVFILILISISWKYFRNNTVNILTMRIRIPFKVSVNSYDITDIDIIVFKEIALHDIETLEKVYKFMQVNHHIHFFCEW